MAGGDAALREAARAAAAGGAAELTALVGLARRLGLPEEWPEWLRAEVRLLGWRRAHAAALAATPGNAKAQRRWLTEPGCSPFTGYGARLARLAALARWDWALRGSDRKELPLRARDPAEMHAREVRAYFAGYQRMAPIFWIPEAECWVFAASGALVDHRGSPLATFAPPTFAPPVLPLGECGHAPSAPHECPFAYEIRGDYRLCTCCDECAHQCAMDV